MDNLLYIGQWQGFFQYGPEYGSIVAGQEAEFRIFIEEVIEGQFKGRVIDWDGLGANGEISSVKGFISGNFINFTKQYSENYLIDEWGDCITQDVVPGHKVVYEGNYDKMSNTFIGTWEISIDMEHTPHLTIEDVMTGTWRMHRQT